ncbi:hypothetical protein K2173_003048 [Erythroxylum novogranatense]|uniref:Uncharacterized protein n=1 Tax=Erythroxylum novogranatense TaxID=1862640 RepID=A0AAV8S8N8_9ROSI|nr:hypothetical protein K2173_003048 [Erythroxylum novogranatense]
MAICKWSFNGHHQARPGEMANFRYSTNFKLDEKTKEMLKITDEDADSFAQRADMYYKKVLNWLRIFTGLNVHWQNDTIKLNDPNGSSESEVNEPEPEREHEVQVDQEMGIEEPLDEENRVPKDQLLQKDEAKRESDCGQLSLAVEVLKSQSMELRKRVS